MINEFLAKHFARDAERQSRPPIVCKSGLSLSVQAGEGLYCEPRTTFRPGATQSYTHVEIGFPNQKVEEFLEYADYIDDDDPEIYAYVPVGVLEKVIESHGGIDEKKMYTNRVIDGM
tara:strand:+ start:7463 stop:7813 length:351 start_codon:yes stop_codon:yes gene_type:complete